MLPGDSLRACGFLWRRLQRLDQVWARSSEVLVGTFQGLSLQFTHEFQQGAGGGLYFLPNQMHTSEELGVKFRCCF